MHQLSLTQGCVLSEKVSLPSLSLALLDVIRSRHRYWVVRGATFLVFYDGENTSALGCQIFWFAFNS
jgi:hypothetical protein